MIVTKDIKKSGYFFRRPSFWDGVGSLFDLYNSRRIYINLSFEEDTKAMKTDFDLVGQDLWFSFKKFEKENEKSLKSRGRHTTKVF